MLVKLDEATTEANRHFAKEKECIKASGRFLDAEYDTEQDRWNVSKPYLKLCLVLGCIDKYRMPRTEKKSDTGVCRNWCYVVDLDEGTQIPIVIIEVKKENGLDEPVVRILWKAYFASKYRSSPFVRNLTSLSPFFFATGERFLPFDMLPDDLHLLQWAHSLDLYGSLAGVVVINELFQLD